jgi:hypothetical protein
MRDHSCSVSRTLFLLPLPLADNEARSPGGYQLDAPAIRTCDIISCSYWDQVAFGRLQPDQQL